MTKPPPRTSQEAYEVVFGPSEALLADGWARVGAEASGAARLEWTPEGRSVLVLAVADLSLEVRLAVYLAELLPLAAVPLQAHATHWASQGDDVLSFATGRRLRNRRELDAAFGWGRRDADHVRFDDVVVAIVDRQRLSVVPLQDIASVVRGARPTLAASDAVGERLEARLRSFFEAGVRLQPGSPEGLPRRLRRLLQGAA